MLTLSYKAVSIIFVYILTSLVIVQAHTSGASLEKEVGDYLLDVGFDPEVVTTESQTRFDFDILKIDNKTTVTFDDIWVRIEKEGQVYFAGGLSKQRFGSSGLLYRFMNPGTYDLFVRFSYEGEKLAESTFSLPVVAQAEENDLVLPSRQKIMIFLAGILLGGLIVWYSRHSQIKS